MFLEVSLGRKAQLLPVFANHALQRHAHVCECLQCTRVSPKLQLEDVEDACGNMRGSQNESQLITALVSKDPSSFSQRGFKRQIWRAATVLSLHRQSSWVMQHVDRPGFERSRSRN